MNPPQGRGSMPFTTLREGQHFRKQSELIVGAGSREPLQCGVIQITQTLDAIRRTV